MNRFFGFFADRILLVLLLLVYAVEAIFVPKKVFRELFDK